MKLIIAASGSKANAALIEHNGKAILIDCGVTLRALNSALCGAGLTLRDISAVFVTHAHSDHTKGLQVLRRATDVPFYSAVDVDLCRCFNGHMDLDGLSISAFECSHDVPCVGYKIETGGSSFCIATDSGTVTSAMKDALLGCPCVMLESNHDIDMLKSGSYPFLLKSRIASECGHLSNADCAAFVTGLAAHGLKCAVLAHISENNNTPLIARAATISALSKFGLDGSVNVLSAAPGLTVEI